MKKTWGMMRRAILPALLALLLASPAGAHDFLTGARPQGMGGAFAAVDGDVNCAKWNPAGLATVGTIDFTSMYADLYDLNFLKESNLTLAMPLGGNAGVAGLGYSALSVNFDYPSYFNLNTLTWRDSELTVSYARPMGSGILLGGNFNYLTTTSNIEGGASKGYSFDLGGIVKVLPQVSLGVALTDLAAQKKWDGGASESLGVGYRLGGQYYYGDKLRFLLDAFGNTKSDNTLDGLSLGGEYTIYKKESRESAASWSTEYFPSQQGTEGATTYTVALRTGLTHMLEGASKDRYSLGATFGMGMASLDYAFLYDKDNLGNTHFISLGLNFGRPSWYKPGSSAADAPPREETAYSATPPPRNQSYQPPREPVNSYQPPVQPRPQISAQMPPVYAPPAAPAPSPAPAPAPTYQPTVPVYQPPAEVYTAPPAAPATNPAARRFTVALLPFSNNSRDEKLYWLSEGMVDILIKEFANYSDLSVLPKSTVMRAAEGLGLTFNGHDLAAQDIRTLGILLNADKVVVGNFAEGTGSALNIYSRIYDTDSGLIKGFESVSGDASNFFALSHDLAYRIREDLYR